MKTDDRIALVLEHLAKLAAQISTIQATQAQILAKLTDNPIEELMASIAAEQQKTADATVTQLYEKYPTLLNDDKN